MARAVLGMILGRYLQFEPHRVQLIYGPHGKPNLAERRGDEELRFNLSHSPKLALYALTRGREVGVDRELLRFYGGPFGLDCTDRI